MSLDLEKLNIIIESSSDKATGSIDELIDSLKEIKAAGAGVRSAADEIKRSLGSTKTSADALKGSLNGATDAGERTAKTASDAGSALGSLADSKAKEEVRAQAAAFREAGRVIREYYSVLNKYERSKTDIEWLKSPLGMRATSPSGNWSGMANSLTEVTEAYRDLSYIKGDLTEEQLASLEALEDALSRNYSITIDQVANSSKKAADEVKTLGKEAKEAASKLGGLWASVKRIAFYRMIRSAIKGVTQSVKEGLGVLVEWDRIYGNNTSNAAKTTDDIAARWYEVKKSIGAAAMPLIQAAVPALTFTMDLVTKIAEIINQIVRSAQGYSDYMKATYNYTRKATDTAKELRRVLFGFDELNVLPSQSGAGAESTVSAIDYIPTSIDDTWATIGQRIIKIGSDLKTNFSGILKDIELMFSGTGKVLKGLVTGDWTLVGEGIKEIFTGAAGAVNKGVTGTVNTLWEWLYGEPPKATKLAEDVSKAFEDGLITKEELWGIIGGLFGYSGEKAESSVKEWAKSFIRKFMQLGVDFGNVILESPWLSFIYKLFGGDLDELRASVKFITDTYLSPDTKTLMELLGRIEIAQKTFALQDLHTAFDVLRMGVKFADGGDPAKGTFFYAGEAGAEVVANTPGGTGVMNMQQMQAAVSNGNLQVVNAIGIMANAIVQAIEQKPTDLYIDGDAVGRAATRYQNGRLRATGVPVAARG